MAGGEVGVALVHGRALEVGGGGSWRRALSSYASPRRVAGAGG